MKITLLLLISFPFISSATTPVFKLHLTSEPTHLNSHKQKSAASSYLLGNLHRNLLRFDDKKGLVSDLAESCVRKKPLQIICQLRKDLKWSDGTQIVAEDFLRSYKMILDPKEKAPRADLLFSVENAEDIYLGKKSNETLGIKALSKDSLEFTLKSNDPDFEHHLSTIILSPKHSGKTDIFSGPYQVKEWKKGQFIRLVSNKNYVSSSGLNRPDVEFIFISEDSVAFQLYEKGQLSFLRRLPTLYVPRLKSRADFHWIPMLRLDYLGFGPSLAKNMPLRKTLSTSLKYEELQKIFSSEGRPGCAGLPSSWFQDDKAPCYDFKPQKTKSAPLTLMYSAQGGEDHKRATEWMQNQWKINSGLQVQLVVKENKIFVSELETRPPDIFRKGHALDRPTCLAALEVFQKGHPENYIRLQSEDFDKNFEKLKTAKNELEIKKYCTAGIRLLMDQFRFIPLGSIHFAILAKPDFKGWKINQMNQLDLSELQYQP